MSHIDYRWYAISTKFRSEKFVVEQLHKKQVEAYIPLLQKTKKYGRKIKKYDLPLISCYVFVKIKGDEYVNVLQTLYVYDFVRLANEIAAIPEEEMNLMRRIVGENIDELSVVDGHSYCVGDKVEIIRGGLTGVKGVLVNWKNKNEIVIDLAFVGKQIKMTVDKRHLRKLSSLEMAM